jgi:hypothetical protein
MAFTIPIIGLTFGQHAYFTYASFDMPDLAAWLNAMQAQYTNLQVVGFACMSPGGNFTVLVEVWR